MAPTRTARPASQRTASLLTGLALIVLTLAVQAAQLGHAAEHGLSPEDSAECQLCLHAGTGVGVADAAPGPRPGQRATEAPASSPRGDHSSDPAHNHWARGPPA